MLDVYRGCLHSIDDMHKSQEAARCSAPWDRLACPSREYDESVPLSLPKRKGWARSHPAQTGWCDPGRLVAHSKHELRTWGAFQNAIFYYWMVAGVASWWVAQVTRHWRLQPMVLREFGPGGTVADVQIESQLIGLLSHCSPWEPSAIVMVESIIYDVSWNIRLTVPFSPFSKVLSIRGMFCSMYLQ